MASRKKTQEGETPATEEKKNKAEDSMTFEEAMVRLDAIVRALENEKPPLKEALALYEEGISVTRLCADYLDTAEQKVRMIAVSPDGVHLTPFAPQEDSQ